MRGTNQPMVNDIVKIFFQLTYDPDCFKILHDQRKQIVALLSSLIVAPTYDLESKMSLRNLVNAMEEETSAVSSPLGTTSLSGLVRRLSTSKRDKMIADKTNATDRKKSQLDMPVIFSGRCSQSTIVTILSIN